MNTLKNPKSVAELNIERTAKIIKNGLENGTSPLIPDGNGQIKFDPIVNANNSYVLNSLPLIVAQTIKKNNGYKSDCVATYASIGKAGTVLKSGEKGFYVNFTDKDGKVKSSAHFFPEQTENPNSIRVKPKNKFDLTSQVIECRSSEPKEYLSAYMMAQKSGAVVHVSPEVAKEFREKLIKVCENELTLKGDERKMVKENLLSKTFYEADKRATEMVKTTRENLMQVAEPQKSFQQSRNEEMSYS